jgi:hypothetical protein
MISPLFSFFGIPGTAVTYGLLLSLPALFGGQDLALRRWFVLLAITIIALLCLPGLYWMDIRYPISSIYLILALALLQLTQPKAIDSFIDFASVLLIIFLIGACIGFVLALMGTQPVFEIVNTDGRPNYWFYTTFSKVRWGNIIRPSAIFDEPGAFSFMICAVAALRHLRRRDAKITWLMLGLGFVTLSLAHLVYVLIHAMAEQLKARSLIGIVAIVLPMILIVSYFGGDEIIQTRLISRVSLTQAGEFVGDNRSWRMINAAKHLEAYPSSILYGADPSCRFDQAVCKQKFSLMGENPLSPAVLHGLFVSWPYYASLLVLLSAPIFGRRLLVSAAFGALLLQRPYVVGIGYSLIALMVVMVTIEQIVANHRSYGFLPSNLIRKQGNHPGN